MSVQICLNSSISIQPRPLMSHLLNSASSRPAITSSSSTPEHQDSTALWLCHYISPCLFMLTTTLCFLSLLFLLLCVINMCQMSPKSSSVAENLDIYLRHFVKKVWAVELYLSRVSGYQTLFTVTGNILSLVT